MRPTEFVKLVVPRVLVFHSIRILRSKGEKYYGLFRKLQVIPHAEPILTEIRNTYKQPAIKLHFPESTSEQGWLIKEQRPRMLDFKSWVDLGIT